MDTQSIIINRRYQVVEKLGEGGMGVVYLVEDLFQKNNRLALKTLKGNVVDREISEFLQHEFEALTKFHHPNLAKVYDFGVIEDRGDIFFTMEYLVGDNLFNATKELPKEQILDLIVQVCRALEYIHSRGIVHCDIKPENIIVIPGAEGEKSRVKLMDFGLARKEFFPTNAVIRGTPDYIAPEFIVGASIDHRADLYSLGIVIYKLIRRKLPMEDTASSSPSHYYFDVIPKPPNVEVKYIPEPFKSIIKRLVCENPRDRFFRANEVIEEIKRLTGLQFKLDTKETLEGYILSSQFIERNNERNILNHSLAGFMRRRGNLPLIFILGEIGTGKTRLAKEFKIQCQISRVPFISGVYHEGTSRPYGPLPDILQRILALVPSDHPAISCYTSDLARLIPTIIKAKNIPKREPLSPSQEKVRLIDGITKFLMEASKVTPFVLHIEDIHWATEDDQEFLIYLMRTLSQQKEEREKHCILLITSFRSEEIEKSSELGKFISELLSHGKAQEITLGRFNTEQTSLFVQSMLGMDFTPAEFAKRITQETDGTPYFIEEVMKSLLEEGVIFKTQGIWRTNVEELSKIEIPGNIAKLIDRRLAPLSEGSISIIEFIAAYGSPVPVSILLKEVVPRFIPLLGELLHRQILQVEQGENGIEYSFHHGVFQEIVYSRISPERRSLLHKKIGAIFETYYPDGEESVLNDLAHHFIKAGIPEKIRYYALKAARRCIKLYAHKKAIQYFDDVRKVLNISSEDDRKLFWEILEELAEIYSWLGDQKNSLELLLQISPTGLDKESQNRVYRKIGGAYTLLANYEEALCYFLRALQPYLNSRTIEEAFIYNNLGRVYELRGNFDQSQMYVMKAIHILERGSLPEERKELANSYTILGNIALGRGEYDNASGFYQASLNIYEAINSSPGVAATYNNLAIICNDQGELKKSSEYYKRSLSIWEELQNPSGIALTYSNLGGLYADQGDYEQSIVATEKSLDIFEKTGELAGIARTSECLAVSYFQCGRWKHSFEYHHRCLSICEKTADTQLSVYVYLNLAYLYFTFGSLDKAYQNINKAIKIAQESRARLLESVGSWILGRIYGREGKWNEARSLHEKSIKMFDELGVKCEKINPLYGLSEALAAIGDIDNSMSVAKEALGLAYEIKNKEQQMLLYYLFACHTFQKKLYEQAHQHLAASEGVAKNRKRRDMLWQIHHLKGKIYYEQKQYWLARIEYLTAVEEGKKIWEQLPDDMKDDYLCDERHNILSIDIQRLKEMLDREH